jgi:hypothetical protein
MPLSAGNRNRCLVLPATGAVCQDRRFTERASVLVGGAFDIRSSMVRVLVGPALYSVEESGARIGTQLRIDYANPGVRGRFPALFLTRTFLGSQQGESVGMTMLGASMRFARKK